MATPAAGSSTNGLAPHSSDYVGMLNAALDILSTRVLALLAELGAIGMWAYAVWEPTQLRTWAVLGYSATVLVPMVLLHWRKG